MPTPTEILMNATSQNGPTRNEAEQQLKSAAQNLQQFLEGLVSVLSNENEPPAARQMAAIVLKNTVAVRSRDVAKKQQLEEKWRNVAPDARDKLKNDILFSLGSQDKRVRFVVALLVANLARIEIPVGQWKDLIPKLTDVCRNGGDDYVEAALLALGYVSEETEESGALDDAMQNFSRPVLDAIFTSMQRENPMVVYSATRCLVHSLNFIHNHMGTKNERDFIVKCLCDKSQCNHTATRERAMEGIYRLADLYYHLLPEYMDQLTDATVNAIRNHEKDNEGAASFAIMFWSTICEIETEIDPQDVEYKGIVQRYKQAIFDTMWFALQCQEVGQTNEDTNLSVSASTVMSRMGRVLHNDILPLALDTAMNNVTNNKWRIQDAAIVLFGCILSAPDPQLIRQQVSNAIAPLAQICTGGSEYVKDSAAWVLGQVAAHFPELLLDSQVFPNIFNTIKALIDISAQLAERGLTILHNLAVDVNERYNTPQEDGQGNVLPRGHSNEFSNNYADLVGTLGRILDAPNVPDNVRAIAQETLNLIIHAAADDSLNVLDSMIPILCNKLNDFVQVRKQQGSTAFANTQVALLCGSITAIARKIGNRMNQHIGIVLPAVHGTLEVPPPREHSILQAPSNDEQEQKETQASTMAGVETVICIAALLGALNDNMWPHLNKFTPFLLDGIRQTEDEDVYTACLGVFGDIANIFGPRANQLVMFDALGILRDQLWSNDTPLTVKPDILKCIGDVALYYGQGFAEFANSFLKIAADLDAAARNEDLSDPDTREEVLALFQGIANFNSQLIQGMKQDLSPILAHLPWMVKFCEEVGLKFNTADVRLLEDICGLVGDIAACMKDAPPDVLAGAQQALGTDGIQRLLRGAAEFNQVMSLMKTADWAMKRVAKLMNRRR